MEREPKTDRAPPPDLSSTFPEVDAAVFALHVIDGRYVVESELDRGTFGLVFRARDVWLERRACVKLIAPEYLSDELVRRRFRREAVAAASVRSEHVAQIYAFGRHEDGYFLAMEYIPGPDLQNLIDEHHQHGTRVPLLRAISILRQVCEGTAAIHRAGVVHRDIKPKNVVVEEATGRPVLIDFGLALPKSDERRLSGATHMIGTPEYMAPEMVDPETFGPVSIATDVYALGCTAFELLTGRPPFEHPNQLELLRMQLASPPRPASSLVPELGPLDATLQKALAKQQRDRFNNAHELAHALEEAGRHVRPVPAPRDDSSLDAPSRVLRFTAPALPASPAAVLPPANIISGWRRVLVVDAEAEFRSLAASAVQLAFYGRDVRIKAVKSGTSAIRDVGEKAPDLILLAHAPPDLDGIDTLSRIRDLPRGRGARVVVVSRHGGAELVWKFKVLGVDGFVDKACDLATLVDTITGVASRAGWLRPVDESE